MARKKVRAKDLKKQRWAAIVAAILALGMIFSLAGVYLLQTNWGRQGQVDNQQGDASLEDYLVYYEGEVKRLEATLENTEATEPLLIELADYYDYLIRLQQVLYGDPGVSPEYRSRLLSLYQQLVEMAPSNQEYRLYLIRRYLDHDNNRPLILEQVTVLQELLRQNPNPLHHMILIGMMSQINEVEIIQQEIAWLYPYFRQRADDGLMDNEERFYYAVLLGEYLTDIDSAELMLNIILEEEDQESTIYQQALDYLDYLESSEGRGLIYLD